MVGAVTRPTPAPATGASRRAALRLVAIAPIAVALTACSSPALDRLEAPRSTPPAPANPDQAAVDLVIGTTAALLGALRPLAAKDPVLGDLVALHQAHLERLGPASARFVSPAVHLDGSRSQVRSQVRDHETALAGVLANRAGGVHDGALARLLAAMCAAVLQRVAELEA
jgi:hypothetical protein